MSNPLVIIPNQLAVSRKPAECEGCPLHTIGEGFVRGEGPIDANLIIIGEAPGEVEAKTGRPFAGGAGRVLSALLGEAQVVRGKCYITNIIKCRPPKNHIQPYLPDAPAHCRRYLDQELAARPGTNVVLLGDIALRFTLGHRSITKHRGCIYQWDDRRVMPTIHPAALMRDQKAWPVVVADLAYAKHLAQHHVPEMNAVIAPTAQQVADWMQKYLAPGKLSFVDIETPGGSLGCVGIAADKTNAIVIPFWDGEAPYWADPVDGIWVTDMLNKYLADASYPKVFHNGSFDVTVLEAFGFEVQGWAWDTMIMHHTVYSEARHSLAFLHSIYVRGEYYKDMADFDEDEEKDDITD